MVPIEKILEALKESVPQQWKADRKSFNGLPMVMMWKGGVCTVLEVILPPGLSRLQAKDAWSALVHEAGWREKPEAVMVAMESWVTMPKVGSKEAKEVEEHQRRGLSLATCKHAVEMVTVIMEVPEGVHNMFWEIRKEGGQDTLIYREDLYQKTPRNQLRGRATNFLTRGGSTN